MSTFHEVIFWRHVLTLPELEFSRTDAAGRTTDPASVILAALSASSVARRAWFDLHEGKKVEQKDCTLPHNYPYRSPL